MNEAVVEPEGIGRSEPGRRERESSHVWTSRTASSVLSLFISTTMLSLPDFSFVLRQPIIKNSHNATESEVERAAQDGEQQDAHDDDGDDDAVALWWRRRSTTTTTTTTDNKDNRVSGCEPGQGEESGTVGFRLCSGSAARASPTGDLKKGGHSGAKEEEEEEEEKEGSCTTACTGRRGNIM
ncbi:hypothetical protein EYF80_014352 [Liparis tanakae]|uniref:Uncharacterized protein n=1 Tax=Liparis tanakae TaxID=230148 RepID=A0A4Z2ICA4_9TELE|nr:hypothetical protein EYF80_014352 [Liparis tanakae]